MADTNATVHRTTKKMSDSLHYRGRNTILDKGWLGPPTVPSSPNWRPRDVEESYYLTLKEVVDGLVAKWGDWKWFNCARTGDVLTAKESFALGQKFAATFAEVGVKKGDVIHMLLGNSKHFFSACFGTWILGAILSSGEVGQEAKAIADQHKQSEASFVLCCPETAALAAESVRLLSSADASQVKVLCLGKNSAGLTDILPGLEGSYPADAPEPHRAEDPRKEVMALFWSSGTTGRSKGIMHSHYSFMNYFAAFNDFYKDGPSHAVFASNAMYHAGNFTTAIQALLHGNQFHHTYGVDNSGNTIDVAFEAITKCRPYMLVLGAFHYVCLGESELLSGSQQLDFAEIAVPAGSAVPDSVSDKYRDKMPNLKIIPNPYGMSELGLLTNGYKQETLGEIFPYIEIKIKHPDSGAPCGPGETGEICGKSPFQMLGYINRPEETAAFVGQEQDGFCHTGDLGYYDSEGDLYYVDRLKELIKYKYSPFISPTELESVMQTHPSVKESMAFGKPEPSVRELVTMVVVLKEGFKSVKESDLIEHVNSQVADYKRIRGGVLIRDSIPRNSFGKLVRRTMRLWALEELKKQGGGNVE